MAARATVSVKVQDDTDDPEVRKWKQQIKAAEKHRETWVKRCEQIIKRYRDDRSQGEQEERRFNILWSNVQTMRPALYGKPPTPIVERRFLDRDDIGRIACQILERTLRYQMDDSKYHMAARKSVLDYLLTGQGTAWLRYEPQFAQHASVSDEGQGDATEDYQSEQEEAAEGEDDDEEATQQVQQDRLVFERVAVDYVSWSDFLTSRARVWEEVEWVGRRVFMTYDDLEKRFGEDIAKDVPLDHDPDAELTNGTNKSIQDDGGRKATVHEIWCKYDKKVYWLAKDYPNFLDQVDDPLKLENFWPCPEPLLGTLANDDMIPTPDYVEYQDQAKEIDSLTQRIVLLQSALKVAGVYDQSIPGIQRVLDEDTENRLIPVNNWAAFANNGGFKGSMAFLPIAEVATVLTNLIQSREQIKKDLYEITGISDVVRGQSDPDETLGAQRLKGQWVNVRLMDRQRDVARFCRDIIRIMGEIIAENFSPQTLIAISGIMTDDSLLGIDQNSVQGILPQLAQQYPQLAALFAQQQAPQQPVMGQPGQPAPAGQAQPAPMVAPPSIPPQIIQFLVQQQKQNVVAQAIALMRNDKLRGFRIDIETDSTIETDATTEKQDRVQFIQAVSGFLQQAGQIVQQEPKLMPLMGKLLMFGIRGFRVGRDLEATIEEFVDQAESMQQQSTGGKQDPKLEAANVKAQAEIMRAKIDSASQQEIAQMDLQGKQMDFQIKQLEHQALMQKIQADMAHNDALHAQRMQQLSAQNEIAQRENAANQMALMNQVGSPMMVPQVPPMAGQMGAM